MDRESQYASKQYRQLLKIHGFIGSMSRVGNCWDNSVAESFFGSFKQLSKMCCSIFPCFITAIGYIHIWGTKAQTNMRLKWKC